MICPQRSVSFKSAYDHELNEDCVCLGEGCAEWDERHGCCGERTKRLQLERIADSLKDISSKIPLGR